MGEADCLTAPAEAPVLSSIAVTMYDVTAAVTRVGGRGKRNGSRADARAHTQIQWARSVC
jgi:hypothetical protein